MSSEEPRGIRKTPTGITGFDVIAEGGLPVHRATLVAGTAGSAKTLFATQFLVCGIQDHDEPGVFVTFEDAPDDIRLNMLSLGWDIAAWEAQGKWAFVDASLQPEESTTVVGSFDMGGLLARVEQAIRKVGARRVSIDSLNALFVQFDDSVVLRSELFRIIHKLKALGTTVVFTGERTEEYGEVTRWGIEEFVADNVVILRNHIVEERRRRTVEVLKLRGADHQRGEFPFTITADEGLLVIPLSAIELTQSSSTKRVTSGVTELDEMCNGGFFRDSVVLVSGATGTGKTLLVTQFMAGGYREGERCLLFAFEESEDQLARNAAAWGIDFARMKDEDRLLVVNQYPHAMAMEDHLVRMKDTIRRFRPNRVALDSLSAMERISDMRSFREFVISFTSFLKAHEITGLFTSTTPSLVGGESVTEKHISTLTDSIILLRYIESYGEMRRAITVLKMRGSMHEKAIREYQIDGDGMHIVEPFRDVSGVLTGRLSYATGATAGNEAADRNSRD